MARSYPTSSTSDAREIDGRCQELIESAIGSDNREQIDYVVHELLADDAEWHQYISPSVHRIWSKLEIGQKLIAYLMAYDLAD